jgi:UDPglucose--hexose-1-phosphate uridylyltransferase
MSELRQDIVSGDWVIIAPGRAKRPLFLGKKKKPRTPTPKSECPFEDLKKSGNWPPIAAYPNEENWQIVLLQNKYPALAHENIPHAAIMSRGIYRHQAGVGYHDLVITRDHNKNFADLSPAMAAKVFDVFQDRHRAVAKDPCAAYVSTFFNWGASVGGSIWHPHYQILTLPIIPPHIVRSLAGSKAYFKKNHRCVRCDVIHAELKYKHRIVAENKFAVAFAPYASKNPFEVSIFPKKHYSAFSETPPDVLHGTAALLQVVLRQMKTRVNDPDLNFFIHGAPLDHGKYFYHHWHIEVVPRISLFGGFEYSTEVDINMVDPDVAAAILRGKK